MQATVIIALFALAAAAGNWWSRWRSHQGVELVSKPAATIALAVLAFASADDAPSRALVAGLIGFAFCLIGDVALLPAIDRFVVGLGAFLVGHLAFVVMFVMLGLDAWWLGVMALVAVAAVTAFIGSKVVAGATAKDPGLATPVKAYQIGRAHV